MKEKINLKIYCPKCQFDTVIHEENNDRCNRISCGAIFNIKQADEKVETGIIVETDNMDVNADTLVSDKTPDVLKGYYGNSEPEYHGGLAELHSRGIHITSYTETGGDGRVTRSYSESSNSTPDRKVSAPRPFKEEESES